MRNRSSGITNGIDVDALRETIAVIRESPSVGRFRFHASSRWIGGGRSTARIHRFWGAGQERSHQRAFVVATDLPPVALGTDRAANPAEYVLAALAACLTAGLAYHAAARGIRLHAVEAEATAEVDLCGLLGAGERRPPSRGESRVLLRIAAEATRQELTALVRAARAGSPVVEMLTHPVPVRVFAERCGKTRGKGDAS